MSGQAPKLKARVALLTNFIPPHQVPVYLELSQRVSTLTILVSTPMEPNRRWQPDWQSLDVRVQRTATFNRWWRHRTGFRDAVQIHVPWDTTGLLRGLRPDVIISGEFGFRSASSATYRAWARDTRLIISTGLSEHTERGRGPARYLLRKWLIRRADAVTFNGASGARYLARMGCDPRRMFHVPYTPVPAALYRGAATREEEASRRLLYVGQLTERKGIRPFTETLARWAAAHPDQRLEFTIVGAGPLEGSLQAIPRPDNLRVGIHGQRSFEEIARSYAEAGIFIFPSLADEWGMVVNEAMFAGLPVLGSLYSQAVAELCVDGTTGWTYRPDCPGQLEHALDRAFSTPADQLNQMRSAARARVEHITPEYAADCWIEAIRAVLGGDR